MSTLIKNDRTIPVFKEPGGFKYPWAIDYYEKHDTMVWHKTEYSLTQDVADYARADEEEKSTINQIMRLFVQNDIQAGYGYTTMLRLFKPTEVLMMLGSFNDRESTHVHNYANFIDTVGLPASIYTEFLDVPVMSAKTTYIDKAKVQKYEDYKRAGLSDSEVNKEYRRAIARMLAVYAGGLEGISLMGQFAMLLKFQFQGKYPGLCTIVEWSVRDEMTHLNGNATLFRTFISENLDIWDDSLKFDIYEAIREVVSHEHALIEYINPSHMSNESLKRYVEYMADNALHTLGMKKNWNTTVNPLPFMDDVVGVQLTDFFAGNVTEYVKSVEGSWEDVDYTKWVKVLDKSK